MHLQRRDSEALKCKPDPLYHAPRLAWIDITSPATPPMCLHQQASSAKYLHKPS